MIGMIKANLYRMFKNYLFIIGLILAAVITYLAVSVDFEEMISSWSGLKRMIFVSPATIVFYSFFTGIFIGNEYSEGAIRNKIIAGHSQIQIYVSDYIALVIGLVAMLFMWFIGGLVAGVSIEKKLIIYLIIAIFYNSAYISIMMAIAFRIKSIVKSIIAGIAVFYLTTNGLLIMNFIVSNSTGVLLKITRIFYNFNGIGQSFIHVGLMDGEINPGNGVQILLSLILAVVAYIAGTMELNNRDLK